MLDEYDEIDELDEQNDIVETLDVLEHNDKVEIVEHFISLCLNDNGRSSMIHIYQELKDNVKW